MNFLQQIANWVHNSEIVSLSIRRSTTGQNFPLTERLPRSMSSLALTAVFMLTFLHLQREIGVPIHLIDIE